MSVEVKKRHAGSITVLELSGRLTMGGSDALDETLQSLIADGHLALLLDCNQVSAIDSQGIKALVRGAVSIEQRGGKLKLLKPAPRVRKVLEITRLLTVIETFDDEVAALESFVVPRPQADAPSSTVERRRSKRITLLTQVQTLGPELQSLGRTEDISEGGLLIQSPETFAPNTEVTFRFNLPPIPPGRPIEGQGMIVRAEPGIKMGIQFLLLTDADRKAIAEFVQQA